MTPLFKKNILYAREKHNLSGSIKECILWLFSVTGGTGFIGSHTVVELINAGKEVVIVDNFSNSKPEVLNRIEKITGTRPVFYQADLFG